MARFVTTCREAYAATEPLVGEVKASVGTFTAQVLADFICQAQMLPDEAEALVTDFCTRLAATTFAMVHNRDVEEET
jgi:hypothetical protein